MAEKPRLKENLQLTKIVATALILSDSEGKSSYVGGYYKDSSIASIDAKGADAWGADGKTEPCTLFTDGDLIYKVELAGDGKFKDVTAKYKEEVTAR